SIRRSGSVRCWLSFTGLKSTSSIATRVKQAAASAISICVRSPAARDFTSRSQPITPPNRTAMVSRNATTPAGRLIGRENSPASMSSMLSLSSRFFLDPRTPLAPVEFIFHVRQRHIARRQHDQQVVKRVGRFGNQPLAVALDRLDDRLNGFFAEFLGAFLGA